MSEPVGNDDIETELSPAALRLQKKLRRLLLVSGLIMVLGFVAVFSTIIFRISRDNADTEISINLPSQVILDKNAKIHSFQIEGNLLYILTEGEGRNNLIVIDQTDGKIVNEMEFIQ